MEDRKQQLGKHNSNSTQSILISSKGKEGFADLRRPNAGVAFQID